MRKWFCLLVFVSLPLSAEAGTVTGGAGFNESNVGGPLNVNLSYSPAGENVIVGPVQLQVAGSSDFVGATSIEWFLEGFSMGTTTLAVGPQFFNDSFPGVNDPGLRSALQSDGQGVLTGVFSGGQPPGTIGGGAFVSGSTVAPVPEPATWFLFGAGLVAVAGAVKRRRTAAAAA